MDYAMMVLVHLLLAGAFVFALTAKSETLTKESVSKRIGSLYTDVDTKRKSALLVTFVFGARRLLFVILAVQPHFFIQSGLVSYLVLAQIIYYI
jgi:hypothetical protein